MAAIHISEADMVRDPAGLLARVREGDEVVIDGDEAPVAVIRPAEIRQRRSLEESIAIARALAEKRGHSLRMGKDFADDLEEIVANRKPRESAWD